MSSKGFHEYYDSRECDEGRKQERRSDRNRESIYKKENHKERVIETEIELRDWSLKIGEKSKWTKEIGN